MLEPSIGFIVGFVKHLLALALLSSVPAMASEPQETIARQILLLSNQARQQSGAQSLTLDSHLAGAAQQHSQEMDDLHYFGHVSPVSDFATLAKRVLGFGHYGLSCGENLHRDQGYAPSQAAGRAVRDWLASPQHRKNLLNPKFNRMGLGISLVGDQCTITQVLAYSAIEVLREDVQPKNQGCHLSLSCLVSDGPQMGAVLYQGKRCGNWSANAKGAFEVEVDLPGPGTVALGQTIGERQWLIETEWQVRSAP